MNDKIRNLRMQVSTSHEENDVKKLDMHDRQKFVHGFLKFPRKITRGIKLPTVEVRFKNLTVEADCFIGDRALPTLPNAARNIAETALSCFGLKLAERAKFTILKDVSGIIKPSREIAAGMYSVLPYAMAQVIAEVPYIFVQTTYYTLIVYTMVSFEWKAAKFFWFFFVTFFSFLYFTYYGMMTVSMTPNLQVAAICSNAFYYLFNLFSGFFIPGPKIPKWWIWYYWICPMAWTVYGLIVSQYGDIEDEIKVPGLSIKPTVKTYIEQHFGYNLDFMGAVAAVLVGFRLFFAFMYAYCIKTLNFQKR
ncbi:hypothetical protein DH2020_016334 [Rehmannia glutinosa]|uniref:ABC-2 type transporter domain-containing protein n=1 Tax=Rehmannia glutinosa TaxID=99300 RepID=A0ABR0WNU4_REHGL